MPEYDITLVDRVSGKQIIERIVARDLEDARGKALRDGWLTGSIEPAPEPDADEVDGDQMRLSDVEWSRLRQTIRGGVFWALIWFGVVTVVIYLIVYALARAAAQG